jgi:Rrf2 family protein
LKDLGALKLSSVAEYGVRALLDLYEHFDGKPVLLADIAQRQKLSAKYMERIFLKMKNADLVGSQRGRHGGYTPLRDPASLTIRQVIEILSGPVEIVTCRSTTSSCHLLGVCAMTDVWHDVDGAINDLLGKVSFADLLARQSEMYRRIAESVASGDSASMAKALSGR